MSLLTFAQILAIKTLFIFMQQRISNIWIICIHLCHLIYLLEDQLKHEANAQICLWIIEETGDEVSPSLRMWTHAPLETMRSQEYQIERMWTFLGAWTTVCGKI